MLLCVEMGCEDIKKINTNIIFEETKRIQGCQFSDK
jgi:hypothetical protein